MMHRLRAFGFVGLLLSIGFLCGCGGGDGRHGVSGQVKYKGSPLKGGSISFIPDGALSPVGGATIADGAFQVPAVSGLKAGNYKVSISGLDPNGAAKDGEMPGVSGAAPKEPLPVKYNASTELKAEVKAGAKNVFDYDLQ